MSPCTNAIARTSTSVVTASAARPPPNSHTPSNLPLPFRSVYGSVDLPLAIVVLVGVGLEVLRRPRALGDADLQHPVAGARAARTAGAHDIGLVEALEPSIGHDLRTVVAARPQQDRCGEQPSRPHHEPVVPRPDGRCKSPTTRGRSTLRDKCIALRVELFSARRDRSDSSRRCRRARSSRPDSCPGTAGDNPRRNRTRARR